VVLSSKDADEAERLFRHAIELLDARLGVNHSYTGFARLLYARYLHSQRRKSEAKDVERHAKTILKQNE
jgi:hypothetical protein